jgi:hypothetical protein
LISPPAKPLPRRGAGRQRATKEDDARPRAAGHGDEAARLPPAPRATYKVGQQAAALSDAAGERQGRLQLRLALPLLAPHLGWQQPYGPKGEEMRVLTQREEGHGLEMLDQELVQPHLDLDEPNLDGDLQIKGRFFLPFLMLACQVSVIVSRATYVLVWSHSKLA